MFVRGSPTASLSGSNPPLIPPYQGGKKLSPFGVALLPYREWNPPLIPPYQGGFCCCPPDKGDTPEGGRGFCRCPPSGEYVPKRGRVLFVRGSRPASLSGRKPPLIPPYQGGKKLSPFGVALLPCREWNPPLDLPLSGRFVAVVPLIRGIPPKGGGGFAVVPLRASTPRKGGGFCLFGGVPLLPCREENPP